MDTPSPPPAPDPTKIAAAQGAANKETAISQAGLNMTNQITPQGTLSYSQIGKWDDGTPRFESTTTLSPEQQQLYNKQTQTQQNLGDIATSSSARIGGLLNTPFNVDQATQDNMNQRQAAMLDPQLARQQEQLRTQLVNSGSNIGSKSYSNAMSDFNDQSQRSRDANYLNSYSAAQQAALTQRNQPINEISALMSGSQVSQPQFGSTPTTGVAPTDVVGAYGIAQNAANQQYQAQVANNGAMMGGLFGLGKAALGGWALSDRRTKENIKKVGELEDGLNVYSFKYKSGGLMQLGLMADEVEKKYPDAVADVGGVDAVNYSTVAEATR